MKNTKPFGIWSGIGFISLGLFLALINFCAMMFSDSYFPKLFVATGTFAAMGIGMILAPGAVVGAEVPNEKRSKAWWSTSPVLHRLIWILSAVIGLVLSFYVMLQVDPGFI